MAGWLRGRCESHEFLNHQFLKGETNFYFLNISFYHQNYTSMLQLSTSAAWLGAPLWLGGPLWLGLPQWRGALPWPMELLGRGNFLEVAGDPNLESKKKCAPLRRNACFFCLPVFVLATNSRTFKNTWFFDDSAGLPKKMCAGLRRNDRKKRKSFLRRPSLHNQRSETSKNQWFFNIFDEKLSDSLPKPWRS